MNNDKLMKIVQAVNDSKGEPVDIDESGYKFIARHVDRSVHAINVGGGLSTWFSICTVEEFNQCVKEMSAGYSSDKITTETGSNGDKIQFVDIKVTVGEDKSNKHPHHDLIVEWAKDTTKQLQISLMICGPSFCSCSIADVINNPAKEARFKPREFKKGHWYPCYEAKDRVFIKKFDGFGFFSSSDYTSIMFRESEFHKIGESLGEIKFGGE